MGRGRMRWSGLAGAGCSGTGHNRAGQDRAGCDRVVRDGALGQPGFFSLSRSPRHDPHHGAAGVAGGGGGCTGVPHLLGHRPAGARLPVVLREAGGESHIATSSWWPRPPPWPNPHPEPLSKPPPHPVGARSHGPRAGDRHGRPAGPTPVVHLPRELRGRLHLLQVGPRPGGEEQQPQLRWAPSSLCWHPRDVTHLRDQGGSHRASLGTRGAPGRPAACPLPSQRLLPHHGGAADPAAAAAVLPG